MLDDFIINFSYEEIEDKVLDFNEIYDIILEKEENKNERNDLF
jgi:hypothetical protein